jgi:hypothetical protein
LGFYLRRSTHAAHTQHPAVSNYARSNRAFNNCALSILKLSLDARCAKLHFPAKPPP